MRVIGGAFKRTAIHGPAVGDMSIRPSHDRTRENVFNILAPYVEGAVFLDLFAGCGAMGIEAVSRGAERAYFVENSGPGLKLIRKNIRLLDIEDRCRVAGTDAGRFLRSPGEKFDLVYIDPPYRTDLFEKMIEILGSGERLNEEAIVIGEHFRDPDMDRAGILEKTDVRKYSRKTTITIWKRFEGGLD